MDLYWLQPHFPLQQTHPECPISLHPSYSFCLCVLKEWEGEEMGRYIGRRSPSLDLFDTLLGYLGFLLFVCTDDIFFLPSRHSNPWFLPTNQGVTKKYRLSWLTNSARVYEPKSGGRGVVAGSQPMSTAVHRSPNKLWRSNSIFNLCNKQMKDERNKIVRVSETYFFYK
jgi:hypothetical protein